MNSTGDRRELDVSPCFKIKSIHGRKVLNSHAEWTNEFDVVLANGARGTASAPRGETLSIHEKPLASTSDVEKAIGLVWSENRFAGDLSQEAFDRALDTHRYALGLGNMYALSLAFFAATTIALGVDARTMLARFRDRRLSGPTRSPRLLLNILNGGSHAYTNPVLSDFSEFLLVPRDGALEEHLAAFQALNSRVRAELSRLPVCRVGGNPVHRQRANSNRGWIEFLLEILEREGLARQFGLMIDASAGCLKSDGQYCLSTTGDGSLKPDVFYEYWVNLLSNYPIDIVEDPFAEFDTQAWKALTAEFPDRLVAGDNLCATNADRISGSFDNGLMSAVLIKPDQAGTVTATVHALNTAGSLGLSMIPSHRSIETSSTFLSDICGVYCIEYAKLGLLSDFETILKLNRLIRNFDRADDQNHNG